MEENKRSGIGPEKLPKLRQDIQSVQRKIGRASGKIVERKTHLNGLRERLTQVRMEKEMVVSKAEQKREMAEEARSKSVWLQSPFHPDNLLDWVTTRGPRILMVILAVALLLLISRFSSSRLARVFVHSGRGMQEGRDNRAQTIALSFGAVARILIILFGFLMVLQEAGMDVKTVLGGGCYHGVGRGFWRPKSNA